MGCFYSPKCVLQHKFSISVNSLLSLWLNWQHTTGSMYHFGFPCFLLCCSLATRGRENYFSGLDGTNIKLSAVRS
jgi:hypothetical protein